MRTKRGFIAPIALALSVVVGFAMPIGDAQTSFAAELDDAVGGQEPVQNGETGGASGGAEGNDVVGGENSVGGEDDSAARTGQPTIEPQPAEAEAPGSLSLESAEALSSDENVVAPFSDMMPFAAGDPTTCSYGNTGGGQYKDTLCWFDLSYMNGATKTPISTQWVQVGATTTVTITAAQFSDNALCLPRTGTSGSNYRRTTMTFESVMGAAYGTQTFQGCARNSNATTAANNSVTQATNNRNATLYTTGGLFYGNVTDYPIDVTLPNSDYRFTALLDITAPAGTAVRNVRSVAFPTWSGAFLGNNGFYTGATGYPALYQQTDAGGTGVSAANRTTTTTLKQISMYQGATPVNGYSVVVADAESTDANESLTFSHSGAGGMQWLPNNPTAFAAVPAANNNANNDARRNAAVGSTVCQGSVATYRSQWASINAPNPTVCSGSSTTKNGTAMLQVLAPASPTANWSVTQAMTGGGLQGVAFGVLMARASLTVNVVDRVIDSAGDPTTANFQATVTPTGSAASTASTGSSGSTGTASPSFPVLATGTQLNYANVPNTFDSSYTQAWQCTKTGGATTEYWPGSGSTQTSATPPAMNTPWFNLLPGYYVACNVTYTPPYVTLVKNVDQNDTDAENAAADWNLTMAGAGSFAGTTSNSTTPGTGVKRPIAVNSADPADVYNLSETGPINNPWEFGYDWTGFTCEANPGSTAFPDAYTETKNTDGQVTAATLKVAPGNDLRCTFTNTANKPQLTVKKEAFTAPGSDPADLLPWGTAVEAESVVYYRISFDNETGTAPMAVAYADYLGDVLDDANFNSGSVRISDGSETGYPATSMPSPGITVSNDPVQNYDPEIHQTPVLVFGGSVPARSIRTVWFTVTVFENDHNASVRQAGHTRSSGDTDQPNRVGYALNNYLVEDDEPIPASCVESTGGTDASCTHHPLRSWTIRKDSQPQDGAMIHTGGNIYYGVRVTNLSGESLSGVKLQDDLTETLSATTWDLAAPPAVPWQVHGVTFYDANNAEISRVNWAGSYAFNDPAWNADTATAPSLRFSGDATFDPDRPGGIAFPSGTWAYETPAFDFPAGAAYAIVGYAVKGGLVADPADPTVAYKRGDGSDVQALPNAVWVNTVQGQAATLGGETLFPNRCSAEGDGVPPGDVGIFYDCKTWHSIGESYFHLWKKSAAEGPNDGSYETGANLVGSTFLLADTYDDAIAGNPSRWLCRTNNDPNSPNYVGPGSDPDISGSPDWGAASATWDAIAAWNLANPEDQRDQCGRFFHLDDADQGQAAGSWRALDIRGGDTLAGGTDPLPDWRTNSDLNVAGDPSKGMRGSYWVVETQSPAGHQLLSQPSQLWVAPNSPTPAGLAPGSTPWYDYQGRLSLPLVGEGEQVPAGATPMPGGPTGDGIDLRPMCVNAWDLPANNQPNCVMPTGWTMPVFDVKLKPLPLTGGVGPAALTAGGIIVLLASFGGIWWWRRRKAVETDGGEAF